METIEVDEFHLHEMLDRLSIAQLMIDQMFDAHPAVEAHPDIKTKINEGLAKLAEAYQLAGAVSLGT